jgi:hypothetical protein
MGRLFQPVCLSVRSCVLVAVCAAIFAIGAVAFDRWFGGRFNRHCVAHFLRCVSRCVVVRSNDYSNTGPECMNPPTNLKTFQLYAFCS